jgi:hypothetical protein
MDKVKEKKKLQNKAYKEKLEKRRQSNEELDKVCNFRKKTMETKEQEKGKGHYDEFNNTSHKEI